MHEERTPSDFAANNLKQRQIFDEALAALEAKARQAAAGSPSEHKGDDPKPGEIDSGESPK